MNEPLIVESVSIQYQIPLLPYMSDEARTYLTSHIESMSKLEFVKLGKMEQFAEALCALKSEIPRDEFAAVSAISANIIAVKFIPSSSESRLKISSDMLNIEGKLEVHTNLELSPKYKKLLKTLTIGVLNGLEVFVFNFHSLDSESHNTQRQKLGHGNEELDDLLFDPHTMKLITSACIGMSTTIA